MISQDEYKCHGIKQFKHVASGAIHDYVDSYTLEGFNVVMIFSKGCWHTIGAGELAHLVQYGIIELLQSELLIEKEEV